jgi:taurine dioxygenase
MVMTPDCTVPPVLDVRPLTPRLGAEVHGLHLGALDDAAVAAVADALVDHKVLFFRDQHLTDLQLRDAAARFGPLDDFVLAPPIDGAAPEVHELAFDDGSLARGSRVDSWHTDGTFMARPPMATMLHAIEIPDVGGDTCWADMEAAYEALSDAVRALIGGLTATHDYAQVRNRVVDDADDPVAAHRAMRERYPVVHHPVVRTHPVTGRRCLFVNPNYTARIDGLTERENDALLPLLRDHVRDPLFQCRFRWSAGAVAFWDNRCTQHYGVPDYRGRRVMHRVVIGGDRPA